MIPSHVVTKHNHCLQCCTWRGTLVATVHCGYVWALWSRDMPPSAPSEVDRDRVGEVDVIQAYQPSSSPHRAGEHWLCSTCCCLWNKLAASLLSLLPLVWLHHHGAEHLVGRSSCVKLKKNWNTEIYLFSLWYCFYYCHSTDSGRKVHGIIRQIRF